MSWATGRCYSGADAAGKAWHPPSEAATAVELPQLLPFPGMQPRQFSPSSLSSVSTAGTKKPGCSASGGPSPSSNMQHGLQPEPSQQAAAAASADEEQLQSMLSALRVALSKKEAALISVAGQLAEAQGRLQCCEAEKLELSAHLRDVQLATGNFAPERLPAATSVTPDGRLLAQVRQELGKEAGRSAELAAERDALQQDVRLLQQQLVAAAQAEAKERERLCTEATQSRLLARARARQVEKLQAELQQAANSAASLGNAASKQAEAALEQASSARAAAAAESARAAAAEAEAAQLRQQLQTAHADGARADARASAAEEDLADARQQIEWQALRIAEMEQSSNTGQLMRRYEGELQRLHAQSDADRRQLQEQLAQAQAQAQPQKRQQAEAASAGTCTAQEQVLAPVAQQSSLDSDAWRALFDDDPPQQLAAEMHDKCCQTEDSPMHNQVQLYGWADPKLLDAARPEIERLQEVNTSLLESHNQAQHALQDALEQQQQAAAVHEKEASLQRAQHQLAIDSARRAEAGLQERLVMTEHQLAHKSSEVKALREANDKLELALAALKEELGAAIQVPKQEVDQLRLDLLQAVTQTEALEEQVRQLKQQAEAAAEEHAAAVQQQVRQGTADAAQQVAAAVAAATQHHEQHAASLQAHLAEAHQQLQAACSELSALQQGQVLRAQSQVDQAVQTSCQAHVVNAVVQTDLCQPQAAQAGMSSGQRPEAAPQASLALPSSTMQPPPSRASSTCESPVLVGATCSKSPLLPVEMSAKQLQLELARVRISPLKPLAGGNLGRSLPEQQQAPSRLSSAHCEYGAYASTLSSAGLLGLACLRHSQGQLASTDGSWLQQPEEDEDSCFATPLTQTPTSLTGEQSPFGQSPGLAGSAPSWDDRLPHTYQHKHQEQQQKQWGRAVPPLNLQLVRPLSSPELPLLGPPDSAEPFSEQGEASASLDSLSSRTSLSHLANWAAPLSEAAAGAPLGRSKATALRTSVSSDAIASSIAGGSSWHSASLDASLARLAALTGFKRQ